MSSLDNTRDPRLNLLAQQAALAETMANAIQQCESELAQANLAATWRRLRIISDEIRDLFHHAGFQVVNPLGWSYEQVADQARILGWRHHADYSEEKVVEVLESIVILNEKTVRQGRVVMGAPPHSTDDPALETESQ